MRGVIEFEFNRPFEINTPTRISTEKDVKDKTSTWFFPQFTERLQVENLLQQSKKNVFLIRRSSQQNSYALSLFEYQKKKYVDI